MKKIYTIRDIEELLKTNRQTIYKYIRFGDLQGVKIGRTWRFTEENVNDFLKKGTSDEYRKATFRKDRIKAIK